MRLRTYRKLRELTIEDAATQLGVHHLTLWRWENGRSPEPSMMREIFLWSGGAVRPEDFVLKPEDYVEAAK